MMAFKDKGPVLTELCTLPDDRDPLAQDYLAALPFIDAARREQEVLVDLVSGALDLTEPPRLDLRVQNLLRVDLLEITDPETQSLIDRFALHYEIVTPVQVLCFRAIVDDGVLGTLFALVAATQVIRRSVSSIDWKSSAWKPVAFVEGGPVDMMSNHWPADGLAAGSAFNIAVLTDCPAPEGYRRVPTGSWLLV